VDLKEGNQSASIIVLVVLLVVALSAMVLVVGMRFWRARRKQSRAVKALTCHPSMRQTPPTPISSSNIHDVNASHSMEGSKESNGSVPFPSIIPQDPQSSSSVVLPGGAMTHV